MVGSIRYHMFVLFIVMGLVGCGTPSKDMPTGRLLYKPVLESELYVLHLVDNSSTQLSDNSGLADFSPDGTQLVYVQRGENSETRLSLMNDDGGEPVTLVERTYDQFFPRWSPDGKTIAYVAGGDIYLIDVDGGEPVQVTTNMHLDQAPEWSPDSEQLVYGRRMLAEGEPGTELYIWNRDNNSFTRMTHNRTRNFPQSWSPDGRYIVFASEQGLPAYRFRLYILDLESSETWPLIDNSDFSSGIHELRAIWSPDGKWIAVDVDGKICIVNLKGELYDCYTEDYKHMLIDWGP